jgi:uracil-DNA glycosylase family 4
VARKTTSNIKKKQKNFMDFLKSITKWLGNKSRSANQLDYLINAYDVDKMVFKRLLSYVYSFPHLIYYYNKYMNKLFDYNSMDIKEWIYSLAFLIDANNVQQKKFMYIKSNEFKEETQKQITDLLREYFNTVYDQQMNDEDLEVYYRLFNLNVIKDEDIMMADKLINNESTIKIERDDFIDTSPEEDDVARKQPSFEITKLSQSLIDLSNEIKLSAQSRDECKSCPMFGKPIVTFDSNIEEPGEVDVIFIGLNPGTDEALVDRPFVGDSGKQLRRELIHPMTMAGKTWTIFNSILCSSANKENIPEFDKVSANCKGLVWNLAGKFPTKLYIPVGSDALALFGIKDKITKASGNEYDMGNGIKVIPLVHPSAVAKARTKMEPIYKESCEKILKYMNITKQAIQPVPPKAQEKKQYNKDNFNIPEHLLIKEVTTNLTFFDVKELNAYKVLMIFIDENGDKKYLIKDHQLPIYIKQKEFNELDNINGNFEAMSLIPGGRRYQVTKLIREKLNEMRG